MISADRIHIQEDSGIPSLGCSLHLFPWSEVTKVTYIVDFSQDGTTNQRRELGVSQASVVATDRQGSTARKAKRSLTFITC